MVRVICLALVGLVIATFRLQADQTDLTVYYTNTTNTYFQSSTAAPSFSDAGFYGVVTPTNATSLTAAQVTSPGTAGVTGMAYGTPNYTTGWETAVSDYSTIAARDAAFGPGSYTFKISTTTGGGPVYTPTLTNDGVFPTELPTLSNTTWDSSNRLVLNATVSNTIGWNSFASAGPSDYVVFQIYGITSAQYAPSTTSYLISANTLTPDTTVWGELDFVHRDASDTTQIPGVSGILFDVNRTVFGLEVVPEPATIYLTLTGVLLAGLAAYRSKPKAGNQPKARKKAA